MRLTARVPLERHKLSSEQKSRKVFQQSGIERHECLATEGKLAISIRHVFMALEKNLCTWSFSTGSRIKV